MRGLDGIVGRFLSILSARVLTTLVAIVSTPIVVRLLGPGGYGDYAVLLSIYSLYMIPVSSGITEGVQKFVAERRDLDGWREQVIRFYGLLALVIGAIAVSLIVAFTAVGGAEAVFGESFALYFYLLGGYVLVSQFRAVAQHVVLGFGLERISGPFDVALKVVTVAVGIGLVVAGYGVSGMLAGHVVAHALIALVAAAVVLRRISVPKLFTRAADAFPTRELFSFQLLNVGLVLLLMSLFHVDVIMLRTLAGSETTGYYKAALALAEYLWIVPIALQTVLLHSSSTLWSEDRTAEITRLSTRVTRYTLLLVVLLAIGLGALADTFVPLYYGQAFTVATTPLLLLLPGAVGFAAARPLQAISQGSGRLKPLIVATGGAATLNLVLNGLLIPRFGMDGAAVATSASYGSMFVFLVWAAWRIGYDPLDDVRFVRVGATALVATPVVLVATEFLDGLLALVVVPPLGVVVFGVAALGTGAVDAAEMTAILRELPDPIGSTLAAGTAWVEKR